MINQLNTISKSRASIELSSIYLGIWPHYIGNPHTNERDLSAGIDRLSRADFGMPAEPRLATLSTACNCTPLPGWPKSIFATLCSLFSCNVQSNYLSLTAACKTQFSNKISLKVYFATDIFYVTVSLM